MPSTTFARSSISRCSAVTLGGTVQGSIPFAVKITSRAAATWARFPNKFPGGQDVEDSVSIDKFERAWGSALPRKRGWNLTEIFHAVERGELDTLYVVGENPAQSEADQEHAIGLLESLKHLIVQDIFLTKTGELADVVFPRRQAGASRRAP